MKWLLDSNILIDYLNGFEAAKRCMDRPEADAISLITWMEVMAGAGDADEVVRLRRWLSGFQVLPVDEPVAEEAVALRAHRRMRLPDAIIWATARVHQRILVSRNSRDFPAVEPDVHCPYQL